MQPGPASPPRARCRTRRASGSAAATSDWTTWGSASCARVDAATRSRRWQANICAREALRPDAMGLDRRFIASDISASAVRREWITERWNRSTPHLTAVDLRQRGRDGHRSRWVGVRSLAAARHASTLRGVKIFASFGSEIQQKTVPAGGQAGLDQTHIAERGHERVQCKGGGGGNGEAHAR